jgi:hypothetical protein
MRALLGLLILLLVGFAPAAVLGRADPAGAATGHHEQIGDMPASEAAGTRLADLMPLPGADWVPVVGCDAGSAPRVALSRRPPSPYGAGGPQHHRRPGRAHVSSDPSH